MISATMRLLLEKYVPDSPLLNESPQGVLQAPTRVELNKSTSGLTLAEKIAVAKAQGAPQYVIDILTQQLITNLAKENE